MVTRSIRTKKAALLVIIITSACQVLNWAANCVFGTHPTSAKNSIRGAVREIIFPCKLDKAVETLAVHFAGSSAPTELSVADDVAAAPI